MESPVPAPKTKFVPKRKPSSSQRAVSATPSLRDGGFDHQSRPYPRPEAVPEGDEGEEEGRGAGRDVVVPSRTTGNGIFAAMNAKGTTSSAVVMPSSSPPSRSTQGTQFFVSASAPQSSYSTQATSVPSSSFAPSDPSARQSQYPSQSQSSSFAPRDPTMREFPPSTSAPTGATPSKSKGPKGTAFGVSAGGPEGAVESVVVPVKAPVAIVAKVVKAPEVTKDKAVAVKEKSTPKAKTPAKAKVTPKEKVVNGKGKGKAAVDEGEDAAEDIGAEGGDSFVDNDEPRTQREIEETAEAERIAKKELAKKKREIAKVAKAAREAAAAAKGKGKAIEGEDGEEGGEEGEVVPVKTPVKRKRAPAKPKKTPEEGADDSDDPMPKKHRSKSKVGRKARTAVDEEIFGSGDEAMDVDSNADSDDSNAQTNKKKKADRKLLVPVVIPDTTTMSDLASARDNIGGRTSSRYDTLKQQERERKASRKAAREKQKARIKRMEAGEASESEEEVEEELEKEESATPKPQGGRMGSPAILGALGVVAAAAVGNRGAGFAKMAGSDDDDEEEEEEGEKKSGDEDEDNDMDDYTETRYAPQMRLVDGKLVVDDASLEVDRALDANLGHVGPRDVVEESAKDRMVNSATWGKQKRTEKWTATDTEVFYDALRQFGTDFEMIAGLFPRRTRAQIKAKWIKEDKINPALITDALMSKKDIDLVSYSKISGQDLTGEVPADPNDAIKLRRAEEEEEQRLNPSLFNKPPEEAEEEGEEPSGVRGKKKKGKGGKSMMQRRMEVEEEEEEEEEDYAVVKAREEREEEAQAAIDAEIEEAAREERENR